MDSKSKLYEALGFFFLITPFTLLVISGITWVLGGSISCMIFPAGVIISLLSANLLVFHKQLNWKMFTIALCTLAFFYITSVTFWDSSYDGNAYHQPGIWLLANGWNPVHQHHSSLLDWTEQAMWIDHYAKGQETICATIYTTTGNIEAGKLGNLFLPLASLFFTISTLQKLFPTWRNIKLWTMAFVVAFPPIIWNQIMTFYIDFILYPLILIGLCSAILYRQNSLRFLLIMVVLVSMACSIKYNMCLWLGLLYLGILCYMFWRKNYQLAVKTILCGIGTLCLAMTTFSFNPYVTNTMDHGSPFYPLYGGDKNVDIMHHVEPYMFKNYNTLEKILVADFSRPTTQTQSTEFQNPYGGYKLKNLTACGSVDVKLGGGGFFWVDVFLISVLLLLLTKSYQEKTAKPLIFLTIVFFATQFIVPGGWFYRYVCYIYLIPILFLLCTEFREQQKTWVVRVRNIAYGLLMANSLIALCATASTTFICNQIEDYYVKCINNSSKPCFQSTSFGFLRKINPEHRKLQVEGEELERIPLLPTRRMTGIDYGAIDRNVPTTFVQDLLLKKGILK